MRRYLPVLAVAALLLCGALIAGCATTTTNTTTTAPTTGGGQATTTTTTTGAAPTIMIVSPQDGTTVPAGNVTVTAMVGNFTIVDKQGQASVPGQGHVHFYMDVSPIPSTAGQPAIPTDPNAVWAHVSGTTYTFTNVTPGQHTFTVQLANNDHTPVIPIVTDSVTVTVTGTSATTAASTSAAATTGTTGTTVMSTTTTRSSGGY
ncbi:MAG: DUF4399 domain-containing protein [Methanospirillum sp.]